jgi:hypothetical protein
MPNAMGVAFNTISLFLCAVLPAKDRQTSEGEAGPNLFTRCAPVMGCPFLQQQQQQYQQQQHQTSVLTSQGWFTKAGRATWC